MHESEHDRTDELIEYGDFKSGIVAGMIRKLRVGEDQPVRTYGDLTTFTEEQLLLTGLHRDELTPVKALLTKRGLSLQQLACSDIKQPPK